MFFELKDQAINQIKDYFAIKADIEKNLQSIIDNIDNTSLEEIIDNYEQKCLEIDGFYNQLSKESLPMHILESRFDQS